MKTGNEARMTGCVYVLVQTNGERMSITVCKRSEGCTHCNGGEGSLGTSWIDDIEPRKTGRGQKISAKLGRYMSNVRRFQRTSWGTQRTEGGKTAVE